MKIMKRSMMILAVSSLLFSSVISCKDAEENNDEVMTEVEETTAEDMDSESTLDSSEELENTSLVPTGTYTGTAVVVDSQQNEVYVKLNDTTTIELYFSNDTQIMKDGQKVNFDALKQGQQVEVEVERSGESLKPIKVSIVGES